MSGLFDIDLGTDAVVRQGGSGCVRRVLHRDIECEIDARDEVGLVLNLSDAHRVTGRLAGTWRSDVPDIGTISVLPPGQPFRFKIAGECRIVAVSVPLARLACAAAAVDRDAARLDARPRLNEHDPALARTLYAATVADARGSEDRLDDVALHLLHDRRSRASADAGRAWQSGIAPVRLRRVLDRIEAGLDGPLPAKLLAAEAGLSAFHFSRAFARSVGAPPHRYVARRRVARAIRLLAGTELTIAAIARRTGFAHGSHLVRAMRQVTGQSAATFRDCILP